MQNPSLRIVVLATGGTIAGTASSPHDDLGYRSATLPVESLLVGVATAGAVIEAEQVAQIDSRHMSFAIWTRLATRVAHHLGRSDVTGIVVTHGTDTMEETAWFLERLLAPDKAVVLTGAMRPATSAGADGPRNLADAVAVAAAGEPGVVVVMNGVVHAARGVRKTHPQRLDTFSSGDAGPRGRVEAGRLRLQGDPPGGPGDRVDREPAIGLAALPVDGAAWPRVEIVTSAAGADGAIVPMLVAAGVAGIVVAATGNGSVHEALDARLREAMASGVLVLRSTRCIAGSVVEPPGAVDAAADDPGAIPSAPGLGPAQARVELLMRLLGRHAAV